jgi:hypothetical protein
MLCHSLNALIYFRHYFQITVSTTLVFTVFLIVLMGYLLCYFTVPAVFTAAWIYFDLCHVCQL